LAIPRLVVMCKAFCLRWVPTMEALVPHVCLNHVASADFPVFPVTNVSVISAVRRKVRIGCNFSQFLDGSSQLYLGWAIKVSSMMPDQHLCQYVHQLVLHIYFITFHLTICKWKQRRKSIATKKKFCEVQNVRRHAVA
jgi:hypothetical protein